MNRYSMTKAVKTKAANRAPVYKLYEIADIMGVGRTTLEHHASWDRKNFPKSKLITGGKKYYDKCEVVKWYKNRQEKHHLEVLAEQKSMMLINNIEDLIAFRIFEARTNLKLTRKNLAEMIGVTESAISHWETFDNIKTRTQPKIKTFIKLAEVTGVDLNYLMAKDEIQPMTKKTLRKHALAEVQKLEKEKYD
jgi:transcriptional regulator with XRE-family HTH domain